MLIVISKGKQVKYSIEQINAKDTEDIKTWLLLG